MIFSVTNYTPTRVIFGPGRIQELATVPLPGKKALLCVTEDQLMQKLGFQQKVIALLKKNGVETALFDGVTQNPTRKSVMRAARH
jgi:alcohol dehydrogenase